jgi:ATP adenylyltransferase
LERLFTPWRLRYVSGGSKVAGCVFCTALEPAAGADSLVAHVGEHCFVIANLFPYTGGHVMIAPRRHVGRLADASDAELLEMMALSRRLESVMGELYRPEGFNVGMNLGQVAGAGVADHIHMHVVPRWAGDANFMTAVGETRVVPEEPAVTARRLRQAFSR